MDITKARVGVCTEENHQKGIYEGTVINLRDCNTVEDFYRKCNEYCDSEQSSGFKIRWSDNLPEGFIKEKEIAPCIFPLIKAIQDNYTTDDEDEQEGFNVFLQHYVGNPFKENVKEIINHFELIYKGKYDNKVSFAKEHMEEQMGLSLKEVTRTNLISYANFLFMKDFIMIENHVFSKFLIDEPDNEETEPLETVQRPHSKRYYMEFKPTKYKGICYIKDLYPKEKWDDEIATCYGKKKGELVEKALNLYEELSTLPKKITKQEILSIIERNMK